MKLNFYLSLAMRQTILVMLFSLFTAFFIDCLAQKGELNLSPLLEFSLGEKVGKLRAVPVQISEEEKGFLVSYSADKEIDPWTEMFYPPTDKFKFALYDLQGKLIWKKELGAGVLNGIWFTPVFPFDLDGDGSEEIYFVNNIDSVHILSYQGMRLEALDSKTGKTIGQWPWEKSVIGETNSHTYRNFILGGYANGKPILVTAQGTYARMGLQAWGKGMIPIWNLPIEADEIGPRGSHMSPVIDIDKNGIDEILWGERCIQIDNGEYLFIADKEVYDGHSDVIQPTFDRDAGTWTVFTCRETGDKGEIKPRVVMFDAQGNRIWTDLELGHMDMGWTAHVEDEKTPVVAFTISRGGKIAGPKGFFRTDVVEYAYDAKNGERIDLNFAAYNTIPVDLDGDGYHEFACAQGEQANRKIYTFLGDEVGFLGDKAYIAMASKILDAPGEQIFCYYPDGKIIIWGDKNAKDSKIAKKRYKHPYYNLTQKLTASGYNLVNLGGL